jgi:uncharacterized membrane protein
MSYKPWVLIFAFMATLLAGCGGSTEGFSAYDGLRLSRDRVKLVRDETQNVDVQLQLARGEQRGTTLTLSATDLPAGVTATFFPSTITISDNNVHTVRMALTADRDVAVGQYQVTVHRTGGEKEHTQRLSLQAVDFAVGIDVDDTDVTLGPGDSQDIDVVLTRRGNSNGTVEMSLSGDVPDGVSWTLSPGRVLIDPDHQRVHVKLTLEADSDITTDDKETCHVRALKGVNSDQSDGIDVKADAPDEAAGS